MLMSQVQFDEFERRGVLKNSLPVQEDEFSWYSVPPWSNGAPHGCVSSITQPSLDEETICGQVGSNPTSNEWLSNTTCRNNVWEFAGSAWSTPFKHTAVSSEVNDWVRPAWPSNHKKGNQASLRFGNEIFDVVESSTWISRQLSTASSFRTWYHSAPTDASKSGTIRPNSLCESNWSKMISTW